MGRPKLYTEEGKKQRKREREAKYRAEHPERYKEYQAKYRATHKKVKAEKYAKWKVENPELSRAHILASRYRQSDKKQNRGECTITSKWMVDNIFSKPCHYCGKEGWEIMGCDRVDNSKPHTPDNVVPCCRECNLKRHLKSYEEFVEETMFINKEMEGV